MNIELEFDKRQLLSFSEELQLLTMPTEKRKRLLWRIGKYGIIAQSRKNVRQQQTPEGKAWKKRSHGKRKMLTRLPRLLTPQDSDANQLVVRFKRGASSRSGLRIGLLGKIHQDGQRIQQTARQAKQWTRQTANRPCSHLQAKKLKKLGYYYADGKKKRKATISWLRSHLSYRQAGLVIRKMQALSPKESWKIAIPSRAFLGVTPRQLRTMIIEGLTSINYGWKVKAQEIRGH